MKTASSVPVIVLTGYLGSGKTSFLNRLIHAGHLEKAAFIINEFGDVSIDHMLVDTSRDDIIELSNGCICCTIRSDLLDTISNLLATRNDIDHIVIETTGLADPVPVLQSLLAESGSSVQLQTMIALVDSVNGTNCMKDDPVARRQIALADHLIVSKTDLKPLSEPLSARLKELNPVAPIHDGQSEQALKDPLLGGFSGRKMPNHHSHSHSHSHSHTGSHLDAVQSTCLTTDQAIDMPTLSGFLNRIHSQFGNRILRLKGLVKVTDNLDQPLVLQAVRDTLYPPEFLASWPVDQKTTRLVFITQKLNRHLIEDVFHAYWQQPSIDTPDRQALDQNPLAIPGMS